MKLAYRYTA